MKMSISLAIVLSVLVAVGILSIAAAALSTEEARQEFQTKCASCHNGAVAPDFEGVVAVIEEWASKYASLDEAVATEAPNFNMFNNAKTWDELMSMKPGITPGLKAYFESVFEQAKGAAGGHQAEKQTEESQAETQTTTPATTSRPAPSPLPAQSPVKPKPTVTYQKLPEVPIPNPSKEAGPRVQTGLPVGLALYLAAVGLLVVAISISRHR